MNSGIGKFLKSFFGLPFLHPDDVSDAFTDDLMSIMPKNEKVSAFCDYILEEYIRPPSMWASFDPTITRTTNNCEAFHSKFNSMFYSPKPNLFVFIEAIKSVQVDIYIKIRSSTTKSTETVEKKTFSEKK